MASPKPSPTGANLTPTEEHDKTEVETHLSDTEALTKELVELFVASADTNKSAYDKSAMLIRAKALHISAVGLIDSIRIGLVKSGRPGRPPSASLLSQYRTGWELLVESGINPTDKHELVAAAFNGKSNKFDKLELAAFVAEVKGMPETERDERMLALLKGDPVKRDKVPPVRKSAAVVIAELVAGIADMSDETLAAALVAAGKFAEVAAAEVASRADKVAAEVAAEVAAAEVSEVTL